METNADALIIDMNTDGGRVDVTEEIIGIISKFKARPSPTSMTAPSPAGTFISVNAEDLHGPQSVIRAAAPIAMSPGGVAWKNAGYRGSRDFRHSRPVPRSGGRTGTTLT